MRGSWEMNLGGGRENGERGFGEVIKQKA